MIIMYYGFSNIKEHCKKHAKYCKMVVYTE